MLFFGKFGPKNKIVSWSWNSVPRLIGICRIHWWCSLSSFFDWKYSFLANLVPKFIIVYCEISKMQNSMVMFTFYIFIAGSALFGQIWPKKIFSLSWNFILRIIRTWRIQWWCSLFLFLIRSILFPEKFLWKIKFICCSWNLEPRLFWICNIR